MTELARREHANGCPDCGVGVGTEHLDGCDVARCLVSGHQRLTCSAAWLPDDVANPAHDCGRDAWTGIWPGEIECIELGWYARFEPGAGWIRTTVDDPRAVADLNRLVVEARWDAGAKRWLAPQEGAA